jgi:hypothetical protein
MRAPARKKLKQGDCRDPQDLARGLIANPDGCSTLFGQRVQDVFIDAVADDDVRIVEVFVRYWPDQIRAWHQAIVAALMAPASGADMRSRQTPQHALVAHLLVDAVPDLAFEKVIFRGQTRLPLEMAIMVRDTAVALVIMQQDFLVKDYLDMVPWIALAYDNDLPEVVNRMFEIDPEIARDSEMCSPFHDLAFTSMNADAVADILRRDPGVIGHVGAWEIFDDMIRYKEVEEDAAMADVLRVVAAAFPTPRFSNHITWHWTYDKAVRRGLGKCVAAMMEQDGRPTILVPSGVCDARWPDYDGPSEGVLAYCMSPRVDVTGLLTALEPSPGYPLSDLGYRMYAAITEAHALTPQQWQLIPQHVLPLPGLLAAAGAVMRRGGDVKQVTARMTRQDHQTLVRTMACLTRACPRLPEAVMVGILANAL